MVNSDNKDEGVSLKQ